MAAALYIFPSWEARRLCPRPVHALGRQVVHSHKSTQRYKDRKNQHHRHDLLCPAANSRDVLRTSPPRTLTLDVRLVVTW